MWSTLLLPLLLLHFSYLHATLAMSTASGGLTVIEGSTSSSSSSSSRSTSSSSTTTSTMAISSSSASSTSASSAIMNASSSGQRKRHRKRNSSWYDYRNYNENTTALEWMNPCGGSYLTPSATERRRAQRPKQIFNQLKRAAGTEYRVLNNSHDHNAIDIRDMSIWSLHNLNYKFLPKLKTNSTIALKRWYRNMQTYVASFAYLRRVQVNWDRQCLKRESPVARELKNLLLSSRSMLCELETAVNRTYPALAPGHATAKQRRLTQLPQISRNDMNKRLKLRSKRRPAGAGTGGALATVTSAEADSIDMRFVKHHYYEFLRTMWQLLRRDSKRERLQRRQRRQRRQQRQRQQQPQQHWQQQQHQHWQQQEQQQQRLQLSLSIAGNRKEFNEVSKALLDGNGSSSTAGSGSGGRRGKRQSTAASTATSMSTGSQRRVLRT